MPQVLPRIRNGVDSAHMHGTLDAIKDNPELGVFRFRAHNRWIDGAHTRTEIKDFLAGGETTSRADAFLADADEPAALLGFDTAPNPAEYVLHALAACLTTRVVYAASAQNVRLTAVETTLEGDMDVRGCLGLSDEVRNGFRAVRVTVRLDGDAPAETLHELAERAQARSAVFDMVANGVPVEVTAEVGR